MEETFFLNISAPAIFAFFALSPCVSLDDIHHSEGIVISPMNRKGIGNCDIQFIIIPEISKHNFLLDFIIIGFLAPKHHLRVILVLACHHFLQRKAIAITKCYCCDALHDPDPLVIAALCRGFFDAEIHFGLLGSGL